MNFTVKEFEKYYNNLVRDYAGNWVLVSNNKVIFADSSFDIVYDRYFELKDHKDCEIINVDNRETSFYGITIPSH